MYHGSATPPSPTALFDPSAADAWPDDGMEWVTDQRRSAKGLNSLLRWAFDLGASRIAFSTGKRIKVRVHGINRWVTQLPIDDGDLADIVNRIYAADGTARLQNGQPINGLYTLSLNRSTRLRFRYNVMPTRTSRTLGINIVMRPIPDMPASLEAQCVEQGILDAYMPRDGMVFVGGATGSGKSTLIGGLTVAKLLDASLHVDALEGAAPVEFLLEHLTSATCSIDQTEIPRDVPDFPTFIRSCWRREATDINVGECSDSETMVAAVQSGIAGSRLTTTIHANSVSLTMPRAIALLPESERSNLVNALAQSLRLVVNQRLVSSTDGKRTALREFLVFDAVLRRKLTQADPTEWEVIVRKAIDGQGQSYATAIQNALEAGRITEETARNELLLEAA